MIRYRKSDSSPFVPGTIRPGLRGSLNLKTTFSVSIAETPSRRYPGLKEMRNSSSLVASRRSWASPISPLRTITSTVPSENDRLTGTGGVWRWAKRLTRLRVEIRSSLLTEISRSKVVGKRRLYSGKFPSMSRVPKRTSPILKSAWFSPSATSTSSSPSEPKMRATSCIARAGMIASLEPSKAVVASSVSLMLRRYESVVTIRTRESSKLIRIPVNTGRVSSREYDLATFSTVSTSNSPLILKALSASKPGSCGKSSAPYARMRYSFSPAASLTVPAELSCSRENLPPGKDLTMSLKMRAGMTTRPSSSTSAGDEVSTELSMSVADSRNAPSAASRSIPPSNWIVDLAETPRETRASFLPKVSVLQTALMSPPLSPYYYYLSLYLLDY